jgi:hypothetical protein
MRNVTYLFLQFLMAKVHPLNGVSLNVTVYKNITTTLREGLLYIYNIPCLYGI